MGRCAADAAKTAEIRRFPPVFRPFVPTRHHERFPNIGAVVGTDQRPQNETRTGCQRSAARLIARAHFPHVLSGSAESHHHGRRVSETKHRPVRVGLGSGRRWTSRQQQARTAYRFSSPCANAVVVQRAARPPHEQIAGHLTPRVPIPDHRLIGRRATGQNGSNDLGMSEKGRERAQTSHAQRVTSGRPDAVAGQGANRDNSYATSGAAPITVAAAHFPFGRSS
jgi:hypothetical protein